MMPFLEYKADISLDSVPTYSMLWDEYQSVWQVSSGSALRVYDS
jgi:hypothetical protein